jgi:dynein heavy chain
MMRSVPQNFKTPNQVLRLWMHELRRVFEDRFINNDDLLLFRTILKDSISKTIGDIPEKDTPFTEPIIFTSFMSEFYSSADDIIELRRVMK